MLKCFENICISQNRGMKTRITANFESVKMCLDVFKWPVVLPCHLVNPFLIQVILADVGDGALGRVYGRLGKRDRAQRSLEQRGGRRWQLRRAVKCVSQIERALFEHFARRWLWWAAAARLFSTFVRETVGASRVSGQPRPGVCTGSYRRQLMSSTACNVVSSHLFIYSLWQKKKYRRVVCVSHLSVLQAFKETCFKHNALPVLLILWSYPGVCNVFFLYRLQITNQYTPLKMM